MTEQDMERKKPKLISLTKRGDPPGAHTARPRQKQNSFEDFAFKDNEYEWYDPMGTRCIIKGDPNPESKIRIEISQNDWYRLKEIVYKYELRLAQIRIKRERNGLPKVFFPIRLEREDGTDSNIMRRD